MSKKLIKPYSFVVGEEEDVVVPQVRSEDEAVKEWFGKVKWLVNNTNVAGGYLKVVTEEGYELANDGCVDFVINSYDSYQRKASEKKKQELLDKKAALELELALINKELGGN